MAKDHFHAGCAAQMFCQLLRQIDRAMLAAGATERNHQAGESARTVCSHAGINQRGGVRKKLVDALMPIEILNDARVPAGESTEFYFATRIGKATRVENEAAAVARFILRHGMVERETENVNDETGGHIDVALQGMELELFVG